MITDNPTTRLARLLRLVGLVVVVGTFLSSGAQDRHPLVIAGLVLSGLGWLVLVVTPDRSIWLQRIGLLTMALFGGLTAAQVGVSTATVLAAVFTAVALLSQPIALAIAVGATGALAMCISFVLDDRGAWTLLTLLGGIVIIGLMGWSRRQFRVTAEQNRALVEQSRVIRAERDRAAALAERGRIARDVHDVLAHTLGGLVMQLDAADALLEAGDSAGAAERVRLSHRLAVSGLTDARKVVGTLREDTIDTPAEIEALVAAHRDAGGQATIAVTGDPTGLDQQVALALVRAVQESLTNARKHAPGAPVSIDVQYTTETTELTVANPISRTSALLGSTGSGAGLLGMRERIAALGGTLDAGKDGDRWVVQIRVPRR